MKRKALSLILALSMTALTAGPAAAEEVAGVEEMVEIEYYNIDLSGNSDFSRIEDAVNEISEAEIGVHVNLHTLDFGSYLQQVSLNLSGSEPMDLIAYTPAAPLTFANMSSLGQLMDISDLLEEYGQDITADLGDFLKGNQMGDGIYGVTTHSEFATNVYICMRKDILEELGLVEKAQNMTTWTEYEEILAAVKEANDNGTLPEELRTNACICNGDNSGKIFQTQGVMCGADSFEDCYGFDVLGDNYAIIETDPETDTVSEYFRSEGYYNTLKRVNDWYQKGYVYKDSAMTDLDAGALMKNGVTFSFIANGNYGIEDQQKKNTGYEVIAKEVISIPMGSAVCQTWGTAVPVTATEPEAAVDFINLMFKNADLMNILTWGIEGEDYTVNEEGEAVPVENAGYMGFGFLWGNATLTYPAEGQGGDFMARAREVDENAEISKYMGFVPNTESFANELTAVNNVSGKYRAALESGTTTDLEGDYQKFLEELDDAGIQIIIDSYQSQLTEWLNS